MSADPVWTIVMTRMLLWLHRLSDPSSDTPIRSLGAINFPIKVQGTRSFGRNQQRHWLPPHHHTFLLNHHTYLTITRDFPSWTTPTSTSTNNLYVFLFNHDVFPLLISWHCQEHKIWETSHITPCNCPFTSLLLLRCRGVLLDSVSKRSSSRKTVSLTCQLAAKQSLPLATTHSETAQSATVTFTTLPQSHLPQTTWPESRLSETQQGTTTSPKC